MAEKLPKYKKLFTMVFACIFIIQVFLISGINILKYKLENIKPSADAYKVELQTTFIKNTVRGQMRRQLDAIRQSWVLYIQKHPEEQPLLRDSNGFLIYSNSKGDTISYNPATMDRVKITGYAYNIKDKNGNILAQNVRPQWNIEVVKNIINIIASPVKAFGTTGDIIVFDSYTGEMLLDNSEDCKDSPEVLGQDGKRYITLDYKHKNNKNPEATKRVVEQELMWRKDTDENTGIVYYFNEPTDMGTDANNFQKYPLGQYNREFQEKIILPYESVGVDGENAQITVVLGAQESEIYNVYKNIENNYEYQVNSIQTQTELLIIYPIISIILSIIVTILAIFTLLVFKSLKNL
jgi:hypothetical protein